MKHILVILMLIPGILVAQESDKRLSWLIGSSQGVSFMHKEAKSNTSKKTYASTPGYAYSYYGGISIDAKNGKAFSELTASYRSAQNGIKGIVDVEANSGYSFKTSYDRYNYLSLEYRYSRYVKTFNNFHTFFSLGMGVSYIINEKHKLNYNSRSAKVEVKGKNISNNFALLSSPTFAFSYGTEFGKGLLGIGKKSRLSLDFSYDMFALDITSSPSNHYFSTLLNYRLLF